MIGPQGSTSVRPRQKGKGPRPKPQPQRTCIACRDKTTKRALIRIVRTPDWTVEVDPSGRANGRGAYLCVNPVCWDRALRSKMLANALRIELDETSLAQLSAFAAQLEAVESGEPAQPEGVME